ncbi:hypothetical protein [Cytobacillus firmus]|uniref:hypothetical protein n=1 Tax=Cytobacillus firmus TaxID=1399 RepID=UPI0037BE8593
MKSENEIFILKLKAESSRKMTALSKKGETELLPLLAMMIITGTCLFLALRKKRPIFLAVPFLSIFAYFLVQIILVPAPFMDTVKFIFSLR